MIARSLFCLLSLILLPAVALGQEEPLPRALIIGDSIYRQPASDAAKELKGKVEVVYATLPAGEVLNSTTALEHLDTLLGEGEWDVIHFNCGLGDLVHCVPDIESFRVLSIEAGGVPATGARRYEQNLRELVSRLRETNAKLVWASTTPIRHSTTNVFELGSEVQYNAIAAEVMASERVAVNDMYRYVVELIDMTKPAGHGVDPFFFDRKPVHSPIVESIVRELGQK